ncbi:sensor histidine kinase [Paenibacillus sp. SN-8-1]|uniref:sensor histidine kinase n=1 Tax=Paenibacillus sp. SN-8-1 TaxID=3435409 RepID=UPI003D9A1FF9
MLRLFASVKNRVYVFLTFKGLLYLDVLSDMMNQKHAISGQAWLLLILFGLNDLVRASCWLISPNRHRQFFYSLAISILLLAVLHFSVPFGSLLTMSQLTLIELLIFSERLSYLLVGLSLAAYILSNMSMGFSYVRMVNDFINITGFLAVGMLFRTIILEKNKTESLYKDIQNANNKLKLYSATHEELTIAKERTRIAQELHDSIGHSFVALSMNLEFAHQTIDLYPDKTKEVLGKALALSKEGMDQLRQAVDTLNQTLTVGNLRDSFRELFSNFEQTTRVQFHLELDNSIEGEHPSLKECLLKTAREAVTNGIRHGGATLFTIKVQKCVDGVRMDIHNNGRSGSPVVKSHGLLGMESRITSLGGHFELYSEEGFTIVVQLPSINQIRID